MNKRVLAGLLTIAIMLFPLPASRAEAAETAVLDPADGKIVITATGYTQGNAGGETGCAGPYLISQTDSGTPSGNTVTIAENTSCHMTISGLNIAPGGRVPAIWVEEGAALDLTLEGESTLAGGPGCAGIYVAPGGSLTISGEGTLYAAGGTTTKYTDTAVTNDSSKSIYVCGGAGIGGNGFSFWESAAGPSGNQTNMVSSPSFGSIKIEGGTVNAVGGLWRSSDFFDVGAGAGLGAGGASSRNGFLSYPAGGIEITGGMVTATGGDSRASSLTGGGAGIGTGGVSGNVMFPYPSQVEIAISGGTVTAVGKADGAGIGAGQSYYNDAGCGRISISGTAKVRAYAGANAQAVGTGSNFQGDQDISLSVSDTVTLWAQSQDTAPGYRSPRPAGRPGIQRRRFTI